MPESRVNVARSLADAVGVAGSGLCALHCVIVPVSLVLGPLVSLPAVEDEVFHRMLLWIVVPVAAFALTVGCLRHKDSAVLWMGAIGLSCLTASLTFLHDLAGEEGERIVALASSALLIAAHVRNYRLCRSSECAHEPA